MARQGRSIAAIALLLLVLMGAALWLVLSGDGRGGSGGDPPAPSVAGPHDLPDDRGPEASPKHPRTTPARGSGTLSGEVRMSDDRRPVAGQRVVLVAGGGARREVLTDAGGRFEFDDVARDARHDLSVEAAGFGTVRRAGLRLGRHRRLDVGTLWIAPSARVVVEVWGSDGRPLRGALVQAYTVGQSATGFFADDPPSPADRATTNEKGEAVFPRLAAGRWNFVAHSTGCERRATGDLALQAGASELRFRVTLSNGERLTGRVLDPRGAPLPGVRVTALRRTLIADERTAPLAIHSLTDGEGRFTLSGLPAADVVLWTARPGEDLRVAAAVRLPGVSGIDLVVPDGCLLVGRVVDPDDAPLAGARVRVSFELPLGIWIQVEGESDEEGEFELRFPSGGSVGVERVELDGYAQRPEIEGHQGPVRAGQTVRQLLRLSRGATLTGHVVGPDGPLGGAVIQLSGADAPRSTRTDREGRYAFSGLPPGEYAVEMYKWGYLRSADSITVAAESPSRLDLETDRGPPIRGRVTDSTGAPLEAAEVWVDGIDVGWAAVTDADGRYEIDAAAPGENVLHAEKGGHTMGRLTVSTGSEAVENANFALLPLHHVRGQVYAPGGKLPPGAYVQIAGHDGGGVPHPTQAEWLWLAFERLPVNPDGSFDHHVAIADSGFMVHAAAPGHAPATSERVALDGSEVYEVRLRLEQGLSATGSVEDAAGRPLAGAWVTVLALSRGGRAGETKYPGAWGPPVAATTDANGRFRVDGLSPGTYALAARTPAGSAPAVVVDVPDAAPVTLRVEP